MLPNNQNQKHSIHLFQLAVSIAMLLALSTHGIAQTQPRLINFQGKLTDQQGQALDGTYTVIFSLYATATGGTALWTERHENLSITKGLVNALLGSTQSLDTPQKVEFDAPRHLGITIDADNNTNSPDPEMLPRQRILPAVYAYNADHAKDAKVAETLVGGQSGYFVPQGGIIMWSGTLGSIPAGWALCDGTKGTPDLRDRFIVGAASGANPGEKGGASSYKLTVDQLPSHAHSGSTSSDGSHGHSASISPNPHSHEIRYISSIGAAGTATALINQNGSERGTSICSTDLSVSINNAGSHSHSFTTNATGSGASIDNRPTYYALAFIMKL